MAVLHDQAESVPPERRVLEPGGAAAAPLPGYVRRLVQWGALLLPAAVLAWLALSVVSLVRAPLSLWAGAFAVGALGLCAWLIAAICSVGLAVFRWKPSEQARRASFGQLLLLLLGGVAAGVGVYLIAPPLVGAVLPRALDLRPTVVAAGSKAIAVLVGALAASTVAWRRRAGSGLWPWGIALLVWRLVAGPEIATLLRGREAGIEVVSLLALTIAFAPGARRLGARSVRFLLLAGCLALGVSVTALFSQLGARPLGRAAFQERFRGPAALVGALRGLFDLDGDGFSAMLGGGDCDDNDPRVSPAAVEVAGNGKDDNCLGGDLAFAPPDAPPVQSSGQGSPVSVVLISIDAWRSDTLGVRGQDGAPAMRHLLRFAEKGALFRRAYAQASYTDLAIRSLVTGRYVMDFTDGRRFFGQELSLAELLSSARYRTVCLQQIWLLNPYAMLGCQRADNELARENQSFSGRTSRQMTARALPALQQLRASGQAFFLWVHYFDPHSNYLPAPGAPFPSESDRDRYLQELWSVDQELAPLLGELESSGLADSGLVVVVGDHGELLGEHGRTGHGWGLTEEELRVPLLLRGRGVPASERATRVRLIDVYPTVLELAAGMRAPGDGRSLVPVLAGREIADRTVIAISYYHGTNLRTVIDGPWKLVQDLSGNAEHLYRLDQGGESVNRIEEAPGQAERLRRKLGEQWDRSQNDVTLGRKLRRLKLRLLPREQVQAWQREVLMLDCQRGLADSCAKLHQLAPVGAP